MCLGIPGRVLKIDDDDGVRMAQVDFGGVQKRVCVDHVRDVRVGEYVLVHVGFALARIDEEEARRIFALLEELRAHGLADDELEATS